jgi:hypothetical protein
MGASNKPSPDRLPALRACIEELKLEKVRLQKAGFPRDSGSVGDSIIMLGDIIEYGVHGGKLPNALNKYVRAILEKHGFSDLIHEPFAQRPLPAPRPYRPKRG